MFWNKIMLSKDLKNCDKKKVNFNNEEVLLVKITIVYLLFLICALT